jgi:hypothetical protein
MGLVGGTRVGDDADQPSRVGPLGTKDDDQHERGEDDRPPVGRSDVGDNVPELVDGGRPLGRHAEDDRQLANDDLHADAGE